MKDAYKLIVTTLRYTPPQRGGCLDNGFNIEYVEDKPAKLEVCFEGFVKPILSPKEVIDLAIDALNEFKTNYQNKRKLNDHQ